MMMRETSTQARMTNRRSPSEALRDPVYVVSLDPDVRACILCKGKVIKGTPMSQVHKTSAVYTLKHEFRNTDVQDTPRLTNDDLIVSKDSLQKSTKMLAPGKLQESSGRGAPPRIVLMRERHVEASAQKSGCYITLLF